MLPGILAELRRLVGSRRVTIVFDRGGYRPKLFPQIVVNFDFLTYRKGRVRRIPARCFHTRRTRLDGRTFTCLLADQEVRLLKGQLRLRQVTRRSDDGHQTPILTSRRDLASAQVAYQAETDLVRTVAPHYRRVRDEGRTLIQAALLSAADLEVTETELRVTLVPQSSPHRTRAIAALCNELNSLGTLFPGSRLRLRYAIHGTP